MSNNDQKFDNLVSDLLDFMKKYEFENKRIEQLQIRISQEPDLSNIVNTNQLTRIMKERENGKFSLGKAYIYNKTITQLHVMLSKHGVELDK